MKDPIRAYVALGSNLGDRARNLFFARAHLEAEKSIEVVAASRIWETEPVGPAGQGAYLNAVVGLDVCIPPRALLERLLDIERIAGRDREREAVRWGPRIVDLDLLLYGSITLREPGLEIPHPRLHERRFVLEPLCEMASSLVHPSLGGTMAAHRTDCRSTSEAHVWRGDTTWASDQESDSETRKIET
jgi:2-amino-4-hydroxy-6-hydroxymethyldihydropteridine diphosphokinase